MAEMYPGLLGGDPFEVDVLPNYRDAWLRNNPALEGGLLLSSPFAPAYTRSGLLRSGTPARDYDYDWSRLEPGAPVVPYVDTPTQHLLTETSSFDPGSGPSQDYEAPPFDPLGVDAYMTAKSPEFSLAKKLMTLFGPEGFGAFMAITGADAERRAIELNRAQYESLDPLSLKEGFSRDYQPDVKDMGLPESERPGGDPMTAEQMAATQYGYFPAEDEAKYTLGHPDFEMPIGYELVDRPAAKGGPYTRPKDSMYDEDDLARFYGYHDKEKGHLVGGDPSAIGDLGLATDIRGQPNYYTGEWEVGPDKSIGKAIDMLVNTPWTGYDPTQRAYDIYKANYARDAREAYITGGRHPFEAPETWYDATVGEFRSNLTDPDRKAWLDQEDARRTSTAATDQSVTGEWNPVTDPMMVDVYDDVTGEKIGRRSTATMTWDFNDPNKEFTDRTGITGYTINLQRSDPDFEEKNKRNQEINQQRLDMEEMSEDFWSDQGLVDAEKAALEEMEATKAEADAKINAEIEAEVAAQEAAQVAAAQAAIAAGQTADWGDFEDWSDPDDLGDPW